ncbi:Uncharacterised protein [Mycobacteroides abscessus]|nr:Uncharacterised protein [Mycobacteroides abscessus]
MAAIPTAAPAHSTLWSAHVESRESAVSAAAPSARRFVQRFTARSRRATPGSASCGLTIPVTRGISPS